jgi:hypothetical protein
MAAAGGTSDRNLFDMLLSSLFTCCVDFLCCAQRIPRNPRAIPTVCFRKCPRRSWGASCKTSEHPTAKAPRSTSSGTHSLSPNSVRCICIYSLFRPIADGDCPLRASQMRKLTNTARLRQKLWPKWIPNHTGCHQGLNGQNVI